MEKKDVESSNIKAVGYDQEAKVLEIEFKGGGLYQYDAVEREEFEALVGADSIGAFFHREIKPKKNCRKMRDAEKTPAKDDGAE